jgi:hypothetical protein
MIARNAKCPCGSGKQYKRCCIHKPEAEWRSKVLNNPTSKKKREGESKLSICNNYPSIEVLKVLSLLQLQPQNHGKNIRLEVAVTAVVNSISETRNTLNTAQLRKDLLKEFPKDYREDPPDNYFTENIVYSNGNNVVYPGIFIDVVEILQYHINSLISSTFPAAFLKDCKNAITLLLTIQNEIAKTLNHSHRLFELPLSNALYIPNDEYLLQYKDIFEFSFTDIKEICDKYQIPYNTIDAFVWKWQTHPIEFENENENPLFRQPFVFIDDSFLLVMPTAIVQCLIEFILGKATTYNINFLLAKEFVKTVQPEILSTFGRMRWKRIRFEFSEPVNAPDYMLFDESIWQVDERKFAYAVVFTENILNREQKYKVQKSFSEYIGKRFYSVIEKLKRIIEVEEILLITITSKIGLISDTILGLKQFKNITYFISLTPVELLVLTREWKFDNLTLWKYVKYLKLAEQTIQFAPFTSHLALFDFYKNNSESFFHSDEERYNYILLEFDIAGDVRRRGLSKLDKIGIGYGTPEVFGFMQCVKKEDYYPLYVSQEVYFGIVRSCLLKYSCPIWFEAADNDRKGDLYITAILYWLNELFGDAKDYMNQLGEPPVRIELKLHEQFYALEQLESLEIYDEVDHSIPFKVDPIKRQILFTIPIEMIQFFSGPENRGERILIDFLLDAFGKIIVARGGNLLTEGDKQLLLDKHIPVSQRKMLLLFTGDKDLKISETNIPSKRYIPDADISYILENQLAWLKSNCKISIPPITNKEKTDFLNKLVALHYEIVIKKIKEFDRERFLFALMRKHESLLQARAFRHISYPAKFLCYSKYYDVHKEFSDSEADLVETSLSVRILIEFATLQAEAGQKIASEDEIDILLAHVMQIVNYASLSDSINYEIEDPEITELPSGRIGISNEMERKGMGQFRDQVYAEEVHSYTEEFHQYFKRRKRERLPSAGQKRYAEKLNDAFLEEWGITLGEIDMICHTICSVLLSENTSVIIIEENDFVEWVVKITDLNKEKIFYFLNRMKFLRRPNPLTPPEGYDNWEAYPWRFNRRLSYLLRPIIFLKKEGKEYFLLSARHLLAASENLMSLFFNGTLKADKGNKKIRQLLAERNKIKGKEYRDEVVKWLKENTFLDIYDYEIKIKPKGFFISDSDKGDIDILVIDRINNIVYSVECKNTVQSKLTYDYKMEFDNYLGLDGKEGLIEKHVKRHKWLEENIEQVQAKLSLLGKPKIKSLVISKNILPLKHLKIVDIPIISFYELKTNQFVF